MHLCVGNNKYVMEEEGSSLWKTRQQRRDPNVTARSVVTMVTCTADDADRDGYTCVWTGKERHRTRRIAHNVYKRMFCSPRAVKQMCSIHK